MSLILVDGLKDRPGTGGPKFPNGLHLPAGIGITGDGHINMAGVCTFSGNVTIGGTLTYEDVTNIDSVGVVTARSGVNVSGGEFKVGTAITVGSAGVSTFFGAVNLNRKTTVNATLEASEGINVSAGVGTFAGNVSIADKIIHTGDTNTAIRFPAADTLTAETGGVERLRVVGSGVSILANGSDAVRTLRIDGTNGSSETGGLVIENDGENAKVNIKTSQGGGSPAKRLAITGLGDVELYGSAAGVSSVTWDASADSLIFNDDSYAKFGDGSDLQIYHDSSNGNSHINESGSGSLVIKATNTYINSSADESMIAATADGAVDLYHNGTKTFNTESWGNTSRGQILKVLAGEGTDATLQLVCDDGDDNADIWQIFADASHGGLNIQNYTSGSYETNLAAYGNGSIDLYYDASKKISTTSTGIRITPGGDTTTVNASTTTSSDAFIFAANKDGTDGTDFAFKTQASGGSSVERLRILSGGGVGIGDSLYHLGDTDTQLNFGTNAITLKVEDSTRYYVDSTNPTWLRRDGNAGMHTSAILVNYNNGAGTGVALGFAPTQNYSVRYCSIEAANQDGNNNMYMAFKTVDASDNAHGLERMRITSTGSVGINDTSPANTLDVKNINGTTHPGRFRMTGDVPSYAALLCDNDGDSGTRFFMSFRISNTEKGSITCTDGTNTTYATSSDYRLKENISNITDGIERLKQLKPIKFNWIAADNKRMQDGFIAHEVSPIIPESVINEKDGEIDENGNGYQQMDYGKVTPLLTAALQEAIAEIETLKAKVAALESN